MQRLRPANAQTDIDARPTSNIRNRIPWGAGIKVLAPCLTLALFLTGGKLRADIITNGSFETPAIAPDSYSLITPTGWTWTPGAESTPVVINAGTAGFTLATAFYIPAESGQQYLGIGSLNSGLLSQVITIPSAGNYTLTWFDTIGLETPRGTSSPYMVSVQNDVTSATISGDFNAATLGGASWNEETLALQGLQVGQYTLTFTPEVSPGGFASEIDNVSVTAAAVPEPSTFTLIAFLLGLLGLPNLGWHLSRRKRDSLN